MLLVLDVGNTNLVIGIYRGGQRVASFRMHTDRHRTADEYGVMLKLLLQEEGLKVADLKGVAISSVVPALQGLLRDMCDRHLRCRAFFVDISKRLGIRLGIDNPSQLGADLIAAADEAYTRWGGPVIVIDMGTATTISAVDEDGLFLGVAIAPGLAVSVDAIYQRAPHLPRITMEAPPKAWGTNTVHSMQAGIVLGHALMVDGLVARMRDELRGAPRVVATGGLAEIVARESRIDEVEPWLVLEGIRRIYERNVTA